MPLTGKVAGAGAVSRWTGDEPEVGSYTGLRAFSPQILLRCSVAPCFKCFWQFNDLAAGKKPEQVSPPADAVSREGEGPGGEGEEVPQGKEPEQRGKMPSFT